MADINSFVPSMNRLTFGSSPESAHDIPPGKSNSLFLFCPKQKAQHGNKCYEAKDLYNLHSITPLSDCIVLDCIVYPSYSLTLLLLVALQHVGGRDSPRREERHLVREVKQRRIANRLEARCHPLLSSTVHDFPMPALVRADAAYDIAGLQLQKFAPNIRTRQTYCF